MPPRRKKAPKNVAISKSNVQTVVVKVGDTGKKKRAPRRRRPSPPKEDSFPMRQLPPVVYQVPAQTTGYANPPAIMRPEPAPVSITQREPARERAPILEDIGIVGTEGRGVEILDVPTKKEQLTELTEPVKKSTLSAKSRVIPPESIPDVKLSPMTSPLFSQAFGKANILPSNEKEEEFLPPTASMYARDQPSIPAPKKARGPPRSSEQVRNELEMEYQALTGNLPVSGISNKALKGLISSEKRSQKTQKERGQLEMEYQALTGLPVKPIISNTELNALIYAEKRGRETKKGLAKRMGRDMT
jgi:hypothetical protein